MNETDLADACATWQGGRNYGSSRLRGAARVLTGLPHYFEADFIRKHETAAAEDPLATARARVLIDELGRVEPLDANGWCVESNLPPSGFAGRGLEPQVPEIDEQILASIETGTLSMPLWGVSLSREVALSYGGTTPRRVFEITGSFPAIPAWIASGIKADEEELICGGEYRVVDVLTEGSVPIVQVEFVRAIKPLENEPSDLG